MSPLLLSRKSKRQKKKRKNGAPRHTAKSSWKKRFLWAFLFFFLLLALGGAWLYGSPPPHDPESKFNYNKIIASLASETSVYADDGKTTLGSFFDATHRRYVRHEEMPPELIEAIVAAEDARFFKHYGVDPLGIARAMVGNIKAKKVIAGGSTLTQQTAKNLFGRTDRTLAAKWREFKDAIQLERHFSKKEILEFYLNQFHVSGNGRGVGIAAKHFFDRTLDQLNTKEIAFIAGSVKGPQLYDPHSQKNDSLRTRALRRAEQRTAYVLKRMRETGSLTVEEEKKALADTLRFKQGEFRGPSDRLLQQVLAQMESPWMQMKLRQAGVEDWMTEGLQIITTIDSKLQPQLQAMLGDSLAKMESWLGWSGKGEHRMEGAVVVLKEGEVVASIGGRDREGFDRVWEAKRLFGSVWKPLLIAHALELGWSEEDLLENEDNMIEDGNRLYWPRPDHARRGDQVTLHWMAVKSENIAASRLLEHLLDPLDEHQLGRLAEKFDLAQHPAETIEEYRRRLDAIGIVLNKTAEEKMRWNGAKLALHKELIQSGRAEAARELLRLPLGGERFDRELTAFEKKSRSSEKRRRRGNFQAVRKQLHTLELTPEKVTFSCGIDGRISLHSPESKRDSLAILCRWEEIPPTERPLIALWGDLTIGDFQQLIAAMGDPLNNTDRLKPEHLYSLPQFRDALARRSFVEFCNRIGIEQSLPLVASLPLGTGEISLIELSRAYQTLLTGKRFRSGNPEIQELLVRTVRLHNRTVLFSDSVQSTPVLSTEIVGKLRNILQGVVRQGTGRRADNALTVADGAGGSLKLPVAGKTGTTNNFRTVSFAGGMAAPGKNNVFNYDNGWAIATWVGTDLNKSLRGKRGALSGASGALPLWIGAASAIAKQENLSEKIDPLDLLQQITGRVSVDLGIPTYSATVDPMRGTPDRSSTAVETELYGLPPVEREFVSIPQEQNILFAEGAL